ncbi:hypothetical protein N9F57_03135 [Gammaproteobacteria bacterium]|nr:hypothetical protein [Gammaproteobacteria bacterium]
MMSEDGSRELGQEDSHGLLSCNSCRYFYITWDKKHPYGCRAMGFVSARPPSINVLAIEGRDCLSFQRKDKNITANNELQDDLRKGKGGHEEINVTV